MTNDKNFEEGKLVVNEENTNLCFMDRALFMTNLNEIEVGKLIKDANAYVEYPRDEDMHVKVAAEKKIRKLQSESLLNAL